MCAVVAWRGRTRWPSVGRLRPTCRRSGGRGALLLVRRLRAVGRSAAGTAAAADGRHQCWSGCCWESTWGPSCVTRDGGPGTGGASTNFYALSVGAVPTGTAPWCHAVRYMLATMPTAVRTAVVRSSPVCTRTARSRANCTSRRTVGREAGEQVGRFLVVAVLAGLLAARDALVYGVVEAGEVAA